MRTTVRLDPELLAAANVHAAKTGRTLAALLEDALRAFLTRERRRRAKVVRSLPTWGKGGVLPGIDLDNGADLLAVVERTDGARRRARARPGRRRG
ncbi:MAG: ribbon-helix-helix domain-containing protein [Planctomycetes bacterium]|nr:ribbon-helix-helix domain-containing protein [Planctomycetota bacterium]